MQTFIRTFRLATRLTRVWGATMKDTVIPRVEEALRDAAEVRY